MTVHSSDGLPLPGSERSFLRTATRAGDKSAWERIYREHAPVVLRYLRASGAHEPRDVLGEVFVQVVRKLPEFSGDAREMRAWVLTIAHRRLVDEWRHTRRRPLELLSNEALAPLGGAGDVEEEALVRLSDDRVRSIVGRLTPAQRDVLFLHLVAGLTVDEVTRVVGRRPGAVKALQVRALRAIRRDLARGRIPPGVGDGPVDKMRGSADLSAGDVDLLFAGRVSAADPELGDLARFFADLERACPTVSPEPWAAAHVAAMATASEMCLVDAGAAASPPREARGLMSLTGGRCAAQGGGATRGHPASALARVAAFAAVLVLVLGGVAFANALPSPLQDFFVGLAERAGISVQGGARDGGSDGPGDEAGAPASQHSPAGGAQGQKPEQAGGADGGRRNDKAVRDQVNGKADQAAGGTGQVNSKVDQAGGGVGDAKGKADQAGGSVGDVKGKADRAGGSGAQSDGKADKDDDKH